MSDRRTPREITDQVAAIEEQLRRLQADLAGTSSDLRLVIDAKGDLLVGLEDNAPRRLGVGSDGDVLTARASEALGVAWEALDALRLSIFASTGYLAVGSGAAAAAGLEPGADGDVLTVNASAPLGVEWQASSQVNAELLAWLAIGMAS